MIELKNVNMTYRSGVKALQNIDLTFNRGEFVSIIGLSGSGKSTLLRAICRLIEISSGDVVLDGRSITTAGKKELRELRRSIGMVFQQFNLVKRSTVQVNVITGRLGYYSTFRSILGLFSKDDYDLVTDALARVGLEDKIHTRCDELSGGQQQRVAIARTIVQQAGIILADEPVASLDPITSRRILSDLKQVSQTTDCVTLVNIHSVELAREYSTRIIGLKDGCVVFDGTAEEATDEVLIGIYGEEILKAQGPTDED